MPKAELPENQATGEPDALKGARPVRREAAETGPCGNRADRLPYQCRHCSWLAVRSRLHVHHRSPVLHSAFLQTPLTLT